MLLAPLSRPQASTAWAGAVSAWPRAARASTTPTATTRRNTPRTPHLSVARQVIRPCGRFLLFGPVWVGYQEGSWGGGTCPTAGRRSPGRSQAGSCDLDHFDRTNQLVRCSRIGGPP